MGQQGFTAKERSETFQADGNALVLDREGSYKGGVPFFLQLIELDSLHWSILSCINYITIKLPITKFEKFKNFTFQKSVAFPRTRI